MRCLTTIKEGIVGLIYPRLCPACQLELVDTKELLCIRCELELPKTNHHRKPQNDFLNHFRGRVRVSSGGSLYYFSKESRVQNMIYQLKYNNRVDIGFRLGVRFAKEIQEPDEVDLVVPVPLHSSKLKKRGYNQAMWFAKGVGHFLRKPVHEVLGRKKHTGTQTKMNRLDRLRNIRDAFFLKDSQTPKDKNILLVDDVLTTGATLESCALALKEESNSLHFGTIAMAQN